MAYLLQLLANALPLCALYAALAFGYSIAFAMTRRADIAYGALFAFAGHAFLVFTAFGWDRLWLILPAALGFGATAAVLIGLGTGVFLGRAVMFPLARVSPNAVIVASLGTVMVLMEVARLASGSRQLWLPPLFGATLVLWDDGQFPVTLTFMQIVETAVLVSAIGMGWLVLSRSRWGRRWRAVAQDTVAAELCGADSRMIFILAYTAAALYATLCGLLSTSRYGTMDFGDGLLFGFKVVLIAAAGGYDNPLRAAAGAACVGLAETLWTGYGSATWRDFAVVSALVALLVLSRRERAGV